MTEDNVMEFCQWLVSEKGIEAGNLSDYINNNEEEVLKLAEEFKKPKFKVGGKVESAAEMLKCGGKTKKVEKAENGTKTNPKKEQYRTAVDSKGNKVELSILPSKKYPNQVDSMIFARAPQGGQYALFKRANEPIVGNHQGEMFPMTHLDSKAAAELFRKNANLFNNVKSMEAGGNTDGIKKTGINYGPEFKEFEDLTGKYTRIIPNKQDTIWVFNDYGTNREVRTSPTGYVGRIDDIYGNNRQLSPEESAIVRKVVESRIKSIPHKNYLLGKYGDEMLMPENKKSKK